MFFILPVTSFFKLIISLFVYYWSTTFNSISLADLLYSKTKKPKSETAIFSILPWIGIPLPVPVADFKLMIIGKPFPLLIKTDMKFPLRNSHHFLLYWLTKLPYCYKLNLLNFSMLYYLLLQIYKIPFSFSWVGKKLNLLSFLSVILLIFVFRFQFHFSLSSL